MNDRTAAGDGAAKPRGLGAWLRRLGAVVMGLTAGLAADEAGLRVYGAVLRGQMRANSTAAGDARPVVAFVGDSNVYGLYIDDENDTLPKQVESRCSGRVRCVNYAVPAAPTWSVLEQCRRALELKPVAVFARAGINNTWQVPPGAGLGLLEHSMLVKLVRLWWLNSQAREAMAVPLAPGGAALEGGNIPLDAGHSFLTVTPRDGENVPLEIRKSTRNLGFGEIHARMQSDFLEMSRLCQAANARLVFGTYLENESPNYAAIRELLVSLGDGSRATVADCGALLTRAVRGADTQPASRQPPSTQPAKTQTAAATPPEVKLARRARLLTRDFHPTAVGYALEAGVIVKALADSGVIPVDAGQVDTGPADSGHADKAADLTETLLAVEPAVPAIRVVHHAPMRFEIHAEPRDRVHLILGVKGTRQYLGVPLTLDWGPIQKNCGIGIPAAPVAVADAKGDVYLEVMRPRSAFPPRLLVVAAIERGGTFGAAQILLTRTIEVGTSAK